MTSKVLRKGDRGASVAELQRLVKRGHPVGVDRAFGPETYRAVRAFHSQSLDQHGQALVIDGVVGPITWWSLTHPRPFIETPAAVDFHQMPPEAAGGVDRGRAALGDGKRRAHRRGGRSRRRQPRPVGAQVTEWDGGGGQQLVRGFGGWCLCRALPAFPSPMTWARGCSFENSKSWAGPTSRPTITSPSPEVWWRVQLADWRRHTGLAYQLRDGMPYTTDDNKSCWAVAMCPTDGPQRGKPWATE